MQLLRVHGARRRGDDFLSRPKKKKKKNADEKKPLGLYVSESVLSAFIPSSHEVPVLTFTNQLVLHKVVSCWVVEALGRKLLTRLVGKFFGGGGV